MQGWKNFRKLGRSSEESTSVRQVGKSASLDVPGGIRGFVRLKRVISLLPSQESVPTLRNSIQEEQPRCTRDDRITVLFEGFEEISSRTCLTRPRVR